jgi:hypothetical protein
LLLRVSSHFADFLFHYFFPPSLNNHCFGSFALKLDFPPSLSEYIAPLEIDLRRFIIFILRHKFLSEVGVRTYVSKGVEDALGWAQLIDVVELISNEEILFVGEGELCLLFFD